MKHRKNKRKNRYNAEKTIKQRKPFPKKKFFTLLAFIILFFSAYQIAVYFYIDWVLHAYCIAAGILAVTYIIINRGLLAIPTEDMLPDDWSKEKKDTFIAEQIKRKKLSSYLLYALIPIILTVVYDMIYIFLTLNLGLNI